MIVRNIKLIVFTVFGMLMILSCKKNRNNTITANNPSVYTAGYTSGKPFYTKDNTMFADFYSSNGVEIRGMDVNSAGDVYIGGNETTVSGVIARYWKNGTMQNLTIGALSTSSYVTDVKLNGNDVYLAGQVGYSAVLWKNGGITNLTNGIRPASATSIFINQSDVYVGGSEFNDLGRSVAKIWKNGALFSLLSDGTYYTLANSVFVNATDIYACGVETNGGTSRPVFWKNGVKSYLGSGTGAANQIVVVNNDVFVAGFEIENSKNVAKYWKNGIATTLGQGAYSNATSITVKNNDVYVAGFERTLATSSNIAKYWKNGNPVILTDGSQSASLYEIVVR